MFKKQVKIQNSHSVANKDKKKMKEALINLKYDVKAVEVFLDDKQYDNTELSMDKIQGSKAVIYSRQKVPMMFQPDSKTNLFYPTLYLLFQMQETVPLKVYLKVGVEQFIFNGADLMWPGIKSFSSEEFKANEIAIVYAKNREALGGSAMEYVPIAVGKILTNKIPDNLKGKAIQVEHYLYDELWNLGPKKIPEEIQIVRDTNTEGVISQDQEEEKTQDYSQVMKASFEQQQQQNPQSTDLQIETTNFNPQEEEEKISPRSQLSQQNQDEPGLEESKIPVEDMDARLTEAFFRSLVEGLKESGELPMEPSDFLKDYMNLYSDSQYKLDFRLSSFKRIGKLLEIMHKRGVVDYTEPKGINHKMITRVHRDNEELKSYVPKFSLRKAKKPVATQQSEGQQDGLGYPRVNVTVIYLLSKHLNAVLANVKTFNKLQITSTIKSNSQKYFSVIECKDLLTDYFKQNNLEEGAKKGSVKLDPILAQLIQDRKLIDQSNQISKDTLFKQLPNHLIDCYQVQICDEQEISKDKVKHFRGKVPTVLIKVHRVQNKKQTVITGLELFQIDYDELLSYLSHKCSCSVTIQDLEIGTAGGKAPKKAVLLQGNHLDALSEDILTKRYKIPGKYIERINEINKKGKKK